MEYKRVTDKDWHKEKFYPTTDNERIIRKRLWDLENEKEDLDTQYGQARAYIEGLEYENAQLKAEIKRLTEENGWLSKECNKTTAECVELQKQVDELKLELQGQFDKGVKAGCLMSKVKEQQAVKDTVTKYHNAIRKQVHYSWLSDFHEFMQILAKIEKEEFGVEVE